MTEQYGSTTNKEITDTPTVLRAQGQAILNFWNDITHFHGTQTSEELKGNRRAFPIHYMQLGDQFHTQAEEIINDTETFTEWLIPRTGEDHEYAMQAVMVHSAYLANQAFDRLTAALHLPPWRTAITEHTDTLMTTASAATEQVVLNETEHAYKTVIQSLQRASASAYHARARGLNSSPDVEKNLLQQAFRLVLRDYVHYDGDLNGIDIEDVLHKISENDSSLPVNEAVAKAIAFMKEAGTVENQIKSILANPGMDLGEINRNRFAQELSIFLRRYYRKPNTAELQAIIHKINTSTHVVNDKMTIDPDREKRRANRIERKKNALAFMAAIAQLTEDEITPLERQALLEYYGVDASLDIDANIDEPAVIYNPENDPKLQQVAKSLGLYINTEDTSNIDINAARRFLLKTKPLLIRKKQTLSSQNS